MQEGSLRADVNVSVRKEGDKELGTRCEIKNVNSIKFMQMAIVYEAQRQVELLESGKSVNQETRLFDTKKNETRSMRSKEDAHDYRYFPDPDLLPLNLDNKLIENIKNNLPELPDQKKERFIKEYSLNTYEANVLVSEKEISDYFEEVVKTSDIKLAKNWIMGDLFASLNDKNILISQSPVTAKKMAQLVDSISLGVISGRTAKEVFEVMKETGEEPNKIIAKKGLQQKSDPKELEGIIDKILSENKDKVDQYKSGKDKLFGFFVGQVMKVSGGKANPQLVNEILKKKLK
jgi:aspartyl-tRNA(Asn)/glutamyl-tRNA(Gln) amidotransferase subunit B